MCRILEYLYQYFIYLATVLVKGMPHLEGYAFEPKTRSKVWIRSQPQNTDEGSEIPSDRSFHTESCKSVSEFYGDALWC